MPQRRIFSDQPLAEGRTLRLDGDAANHVARVLRLRCGDALVVFDGSGRDFAAEITALGRNEVTVRLGAATAVISESPAVITLFQGVCRGPRMDTVIQKATELGVARVVPVLTERSVVRLEHSQATRKLAHWQRVAVSACEQSCRSRIPEVSEPLALHEALQLATILPVRLLLDPAGNPMPGPSAAPGSIGLLIGPEGGLTEAERDTATAHGFQRVRLGPRIMRTETAPLAALAVLQYLYGDLR